MTMAMIIVATLAFMAGLLWACFCAQHFVNFALSAELVGHTESVIAVITFHTHERAHLSWIPHSQVPRAYSQGHP